MQTAEERQRLLGRYADEQPRPLVTVLRCAAGIAMLFAVAAGPWLVLHTDRGGAVAENPQKAVAAYPNSMEESRRVFEERERARREQEGTKAALAK